MILGEPGIGKTRLMAELSEQAWRDGAFVLRGGCFEAEWSPPFAPFAEALGAHVATARPEELRADMGPGGGPHRPTGPRRPRGPARGRTTRRPSSPTRNVSGSSTPSPRSC